MLGLQIPVPCSLQLFSDVGSAASTDQTFMRCLISHGCTTDLYTQNASLCLCCSSDNAADSDKLGGNCCFVWTGKTL